MKYLSPTVYCILLFSPFTTIKWIYRLPGTMERMSGQYAPTSNVLTKLPFPYRIVMSLGYHVTVDTLSFPML